MRGTIGVNVVPHDLSGRADAYDLGVDGTGEVNGRVSAVAQQKAVRYYAGIGVASYDVAAGVNAGGAGISSAGRLGGSARWTENNPSGPGRVNCGETAVAQQKAVAFAGGIVIPSHDVPDSVDVEGKACIRTALGK